MKLPRPRFSTRALFVLMTAVALVCGSMLAQVRARQQVVADYRSRGIHVAIHPASRNNPARRSASWTTPAAWFQPVRLISVERGKLTSIERNHLQRHFPEADVVEVVVGIPFSQPILPDSRPFKFPNPS